jgi:hypothetical protein
MAAFSGTVTNNLTYEEGDRFGKRIRIRRNLTIVLATQGGATNTIGGVALGIASGQIQSVYCVQFTDGGTQKRAVWLFTDGTNVYVGDPTQATDANRAIPADVTGTLVLEIAGLPL